MKRIRTCALIVLGASIFGLSAGDAAPSAQALGEAAEADAGWLVALSSEQLELILDGINLRSRTDRSGVVLPELLRLNRHILTQVEIRLVGQPDNLTLKSLQNKATLNLATLKMAELRLSRR